MGIGQRWSENTRTYAELNLLFGNIEEGKTLFLKLINIGDLDNDGRRTFSRRLNGMTRSHENASHHLRPTAGVIAEVLITTGDSIDSSDLIFRLK